MNTLMPQQRSGLMLNRFLFLKPHNRLTDKDTYLSVVGRDYSFEAIRKYILFTLL